MTEKVTREKHVEIRWIGDETTEAALLRAIGLDDLSVPAPGAYERWLSVPTRKSNAAIKALIASGARLLKPEPGP